MKKLICMTLIFIMTVSLCAPVTAVETTATQDAEIKKNNEYGFTYTEQVDEAHNTVRTYNKQENTVSNLARTATHGSDFGASTEERTKAILTDLGMSPAFVSELTAEDLEEYANSTQIISVVTYQKTDAEGKVVNIPEEEALAYTRSRPNIEEMLPPMDGAGIAAAESESWDDGLRINFVISYEGSGVYKFSINAEWFEDPTWRFTDSLGACAQNIAIENNTRSGWYKYDLFMMYAGNTYESNDEKETLTNYQNATGLGNWDGSAVIFDLHDSFVTDTYDMVLYSNHRVHYEFKATIHQWQSETNFDATATYSQRRIGATFSPSLSITSEEYVIGIGLNVTTFLKKYPVELGASIKHIP